MHGIPGLTSKKVQNFINDMCKYAETYLEVGCYLGATACAALHKNNIEVYLVDNWKEDIQPFRNDLPNLPPNDKELFRQFIKNSKGDNKVNIFDCDMFDVDLSHIKPIDVFFYDADKTKVKEAIEYYWPVLSDTAIIIIDDANDKSIVEAAQSALTGISYERIIMNDIEDEKEWWNGIYIAIVNK
jgi:hypothetical protein